ncbi:MAG TPA: SRPBCC domain-containing protein [Flavipsychrobacter sp.]|nr:SRPBCC domain-containing protein [Flavipsychrobacter sp.]
MSTANKTTVTVSVNINASIDVVWEKWTNPEDITKWYFASDDWHAPNAKNDLRTGGQFSTTMAAKDSSFSFDFVGTYDLVEEHTKIDFTIGDGRKVNVTFTNEGTTTTVTETFETEEMNSIEMQQAGWKAILNNFKKYVETNS